MPRFSTSAHFSNAASTSLNTDSIFSWCFFILSFSLSFSLPLNFPVRDIFATIVYPMPRLLIWSMMGLHDVLFVILSIGGRFVSFKILRSSLLSFSFFTGENTSLIALESSAINSSSMFLIFFNSCLTSFRCSLRFSEIFIWVSWLMWAWKRMPISISYGRYRGIHICIIFIW